MNAENVHAKLAVHKAAIGRYSKHNPTFRVVTCLCIVYVTDN